jgi:hypothetical protein
LTAHNAVSWVWRAACDRGNAPNSKQAVTQERTGEKAEKVKSSTALRAERLPRLAMLLISVANVGGLRPKCKRKTSKIPKIILSFKKGVSIMQTIIHNTNANATVKAKRKPLKFKQRIGSTEFTVSVHFSERSSETLEDKILRLIESEVVQNA